MAVAGPAYPTTATTSSETPWSDNDWDTPGAVTADDGTTASVTHPTFDSPDRTYVLKATGFNFSAIPDGSTINGVTARVNGWYNLTTGTGSLGLCQLLDATGAKVGTNQCATPVALTLVNTTVITKGGASDLWGNALTAAWVKDPDFGVALGVQATQANADVFIDYVTLEIDYTAPSIPNTGSASGALSWVGSATGARVSSGATSGSLTYVGTATGATVHSGAASGSMAWSGSATGVAPTSVKQGAAAGAVSWTGSATGARQSTGSASGAVTRSGSADGARASAGAASGTVDRVGVATGARASTGAAIGSLTYAGSTTGTRTSAGSVAGVVAWTGSATGTAPTLGTSTGAVAGAVAWTGSATGARTSDGAVAGAVAWAGTATGSAPTNAPARWRLVRAGTWDYATLGFIADNGAVLVGERPDAHWVLCEDQGAPENVSWYSYRIDIVH